MLASHESREKNRKLNITFDRNPEKKDIPQLYIVRLYIVNKLSSSSFHEFYL